MEKSIWFRLRLSIIAPQALTDKESFFPAFMAKISRIVVKLGTQVVVDPETSQPAMTRLRDILDDIAAIRRAGTQVILVSSGAVGLGRQTCGIFGPVDLPLKQACAAVGQSRLMALYDEICSEHRITVAQILVTSRDFTSRTSYLNLRGSCEALLSLNTLPIFNENDVVSVAGIREQDVASDMRGQKSFDDNDKLSALVAAKLSADMLVILTNVDGVYSDNPNTNPHAALISRISSLHDLDAVSCSGKSSLGRGGMSSKLDAAKIAGMCGVTTIISSAWSQNPVSSAMQGQQGTTVSLGDSVPIPRLNGRQRWFGLSSGYAGAVTIDARARHTLESAPCSLLPVGVLKVDGDFGPGDIISIVDEGGEEIGRGVSNQSADSLRQIAGKKTHEARALLPRDEKEEVIHRDNLVIFTESHHAA